MVSVSLTQHVYLLPSSTISITTHDWIFRIGIESINQYSRICNCRSWKDHIKKAFDSYNVFKILPIRDWILDWDEGSCSFQNRTSTIDIETWTTRSRFQPCSIASVIFKQFVVRMCIRKAITIFMHSHQEFLLPKFHSCYVCHSSVFIHSDLQFFQPDYNLLSN